MLNHRNIHACDWIFEPLESRVLLTALFEIESIADGCAGDSVPADINDVGTVIGNCFLAKPGLSASYAFTWTTQAGFQKLPGLDGVSNSARVLGPDGRIVGGLSNSNRPYTTFVYEDGGIHPFDPEQLNPFNSDAIAAFRGRTVVGPGLIASHRYQWVVELFGGSPRNFGVPNSARFIDVNNRGTVILNSDGPEILDGSILRPLQELIVNLSGWRIDEAKALNNLGQIVGTGLHNGKLEAFILTPVSESSEPFPLGPNDSEVVWDVRADWTPPDPEVDETANNSDDHDSDDSTSDDTEDSITNIELVIDADVAARDTFVAVTASAIDDDLLSSPDPLAALASARNLLT